MVYPLLYVDNMKIHQRKDNYPRAKGLVEVEMKDLGGSPENSRYGHH